MSGKITTWLHAPPEEAPPAEQQQRTKQERITRLRKRMQQLRQRGTEPDPVDGIILGILDLLDDEL